MQVVIAVLAVVSLAAPSSSTALSGKTHRDLAAATQVSLHLRAWVDGRSDLIVSGNTAHWHHYDYAVPGRLAGVDLPTYLNGVPWMPVWPSPGENRDCHCDSSTFTGLDPPVPPLIESATLTRVGDGCRYSCTLTYSGGQFTVEFDDNPPGGAAWYEVQVDVNGTTAADAWDLASDFQVAPNQANPNPDRYGNPGVWRFMQGAILHEPSNYTLLEQFTPNGGVTPTEGLESWHGGLGDGFPGVAFNASGADYTGWNPGPGVWPANTVEAHPYPGVAAIVGWRSPVSGTLRVDAVISDIDPYCGDGVGWSLDDGSSTLASGRIANGGQPQSASRTVDVQQGTTLYAIVDDGGSGNYVCDSTLLSVGVAPVDLTLGSLPAATAGEPYDQTIDVTGGTAPYTLSLVSGALPPGLSLSSVGELSGTPTAAGSSIFTVQATDSSTPAKLGARAYTLTVSPGPFARISVTVATPVAVYAPFVVTAKAEDSAGDLLTGYDASATWTALSGGLAPSSPSSFVHGVSTTYATIDSVLAGERITVASGGISGQSSLFDVGPPPSPSSIALSVTSAGGPATVGSPFILTATARDANGARLRGYYAPATWSDRSGALSPAMPSAFVDGVSTTSATISVPAHDNRVTVSSVGFSGRSKQFNVLGPVVGFEPRVTTPVVAGSPFTVAVFAVDAAHNRLGGYSGPATWSDRSGALTPATPSPFLDGVATTSATIPTPFHDDRITVISGGLSGRSTQFGVHGPLAGFHFRIATPVSAGSPFTVTVFARDAAGNRLKSYSGPAIWSDRSGALSPATPSAFVDGVSTTSATIAVPAHDERITLTSGGRTGSSGQFNVR